MATYSRKELLPNFDLFNFCIDVLTEAAQNNGIRKALDPQYQPPSSIDMLNQTADMAATVTKLDRGYIVAGMRMVIADRQAA